MGQRRDKLDKRRAKQLKTRAANAPRKAKERARKAAAAETPTRGRTFTKPWAQHATMEPVDTVPDAATSAVTAVVFSAICCFK